jgi:hypothetical protein
MGVVGDVATATPFAEAQSVPPAQAGSINVGRRARILRSAEPESIVKMRDDALLAWVESAGQVRESGTLEYQAMGTDSAESDTGAHSCDALDVAVGELVNAAVL